MKQPAISSLFQSQKHYDDSTKNEFSIPTNTLKQSQDVKKGKGQGNTPIELSLSGATSAQATSSIAAGSKTGRRSNRRKSNS